jgi:histone H3/H4
MVDEMDNPPPEQPAAKKERELLIVQSKVREIIRAREMRASDDFITALSEHVQHVIERAIQRAAANKRSTLRDADV